MIDEPSWLFFKQTAIGMNHDCLLMLDCLVVTSLTEACSMVEETSSYSLEYSFEDRDDIYYYIPYFR